MENKNLFEEIKDVQQSVLKNLSSFKTLLSGMNIEEQILQYYINALDVIISRVTNSKIILTDKYNLINIQYSIYEISSAVEEASYTSILDKENKSFLYYQILIDKKQFINIALEDSSKLPYIISSYPNEIINNLETFIDSSREHIIENTEILEDKINKLEIDLKNQTSLIESFKSNIDLEAERLKNISNLSTSIKENVNNELEAFNLKIKNLETTYQETLAKVSQENEEKSQKIINELNAKLEDAKKILNLIGDTGIIGNYTKVANEHQKIANMFRWISIAIMLVMAGILVYTLYLLSTTEFNIQLTITRIIIASLLTYPAIYASRESSKHRTLETKNRSLELELASLSPFIELMNEEDKLAIKKELIPKYFTGIAQETLNKEKDMETMVDQIQKLSKAIAPLINKDK